ncbi:hypothetical protein [Nostoc sp.]
MAEAVVFAALSRYTTGTVMDTSGGIALGRVTEADKKASFGGQAF